MDVLIKNMPLHIRKLVYKRLTNPKAKDINMGFNWNRTPEGHAFWQDISHGFYEVYWLEYPRKKPRKKPKNIPQAKINLARW